MIGVLVLSIPGFNPTSSMLMLSGVALVVGLISPWVGSYVDAGSGRVWCLLALGLHTAGILGILYSDQLGYILISISLLCFFVSLMVIAVASSAFIEGYVTDAVRRSSAMYWAIAGNAGMLSSNAFAFYFLKDHRTALLIIDLLTTSLFILYLVFVVSGPSKQRSAPAPTSYFSGLGRIAIMKPAAVVSTLLLFISIYAQMYVLPVVLRDAGLDYIRLVPLVGIINSAIVIGVGFLVGRNYLFASDSLREKLVFVLIGTGFFLFPYSQNTAIFIFSTVLWSVGEVLIYPVSANFIYSLFPTEQSGMGAALKTILMRMAQVVAPLGALGITYLSTVGQAFALGLPFLICLLAIPRTRTTFRSSEKQ